MQRAVVIGGGWRAVAGHARVDAAGRAAMLLLPFMLFHGRAIADILICAIDLLFLARSAATSDWAWARRPWVGVAALFWLWLVLATIVMGDGPALGQSVVVVRLLLFVAACEAFTLADAETRRWFAIVVSAGAAWIALETWQQFLFGTNLFGHGRARDGVLTGPFMKERAAPQLYAVFFPALLPWLVRLASSARPAARSAALLLLALGVATMVLIGQRMPLLMVLFGIAIGAALVPRLRPAAAAALLAGAALLALTPIISPPTFHKVVVFFWEQMSHFWLSAYGQIYLRAFAIFRDSPWLGLGYDGFRDNCADPRFFIGSASLGVADGQVNAVVGCNIHPHNYWLEIATAAGAPGVLLWAALAALWLRDLTRGLLPGAQPIRTALLVSAIVMLWPLAATSSLFVVDSGGWLFLMVGWGLAEAAAVRPGS